MNHNNFAIKFAVDLELKTSLLLSSGQEGEFTDSSIEKTPDGKVHINGYVWNSLIRRSMARLKGIDDILKKIGKNEDEGVSSLWFEASFIDIPVFDIRPGNKIDREWGSGVSGALYNDEIVPPGITTTLCFNYFCAESKVNKIKESLLNSLWIINEGIENIGGGWSYGFGKLAVKKIQYKIIDLRKENDRKLLWQFEELENNEKPWNLCEIESLKQPDIVKPWIKIIAKARLTEGQLLAVHSKDSSSFMGEELPESFVFTRYVINNQTGKISPEIAIPGRTLRQALLSAPIERKLRSTDKPACIDSSVSDHCSCERCMWFGSNDAGGIISVSDAPVNNADSIVLHRIQLCEHSMQNMNLFSGEYMTTGEFDIEILIDNKEEKHSKELVKSIEALFEEMKINSAAPPGWYRIGATSTCTGQITINKYEKSSYGPIN